MAHPCAEPRFGKFFLHYRRGSPYLSEKSSDFDEIWYDIADIEHDDSHMTKNWIFYLENPLFVHYSLNDCPIWAEFCTRKQNGMRTKATWQKLQIF